MSPPPKEHGSQEKIYLLKSTSTTKNKMCTKKIYFTINSIHLMHKACQILSTFTSQCHCLHLHSTRCDNLIPRIVAACRWGVESGKLMYSSTFGHVPTCIYMSHRPNELFIPKQQRKYYVSMVHGWWKNE